MAGSYFFKQPVRRFRKIEQHRSSPQAETHPPESTKSSVATDDVDSQFNDIVKNYEDSTEHPLGAMEANATKRTAETGDTEKALSPEEVQNAEKEAAPRDEPSWYKQKEKRDDGKHPLFRFGLRIRSKKRATVTGGLVGLALVASIFAGGSFGSGIIQAIYAGEILSNIHLYDSRVLTDERLLTIVRLMRDPSKPQNTRMGILGNELADRVEARFNANGISSSYTKGLGYLNGYVIDPAKLDGDLAEMKGKSAAEITDFFKEKYGVRLEPHPRAPGKLFASAEGLSLLQKRKLSRTIVGASGYRGIMGPLVFRFMVPRNSLDLHRATLLKLLRPIQGTIEIIQDGALERLDKRLTMELERRQYIQNGAGPPQISSSISADPENKELVDNANTVADAAENAVEQASGTTEQRSLFERNLKLKLAGTVGTGVIHGANAAEFVGIACTIKYLAETFDQLKMASVVLPLMRMGMEVVSYGDQAKSGTDIDLEILGLFSDLFYDEKTGTNFTDAQPIQYEYGEPLTGPADPPEVRINTENNIFSKITNSIPGLDGVCAVLNNGGVEIGLTVLGFIGGPISASLGFAAGLAIQQYLPTILSSLAGEPIDTAAQGAEFGAYAMYGTFFAGNDARSIAGGRIMTPEEQMQVTEYKNLYAMDDFQSQSLAYRLFNTHDYRSLTSSILFRYPLRSDRVVGSMSNLLGAFTAPGRLIGGLFSTHVSAAGPKVPYDYGMPYVGTTIDEMSSPAVENPFANASVVVNEILPGANGQKYIDRAKICNGVLINNDGTIGSTNEPVQITDVTNPANGCGDRGTDWLRVRFYIKDTEILEAVACYEGDEEACGNLEYSDVSNDEEETVLNSTGSSARYGSIW